MIKRRFTPYEYNQLLKYGYDPESVSALADNTPVEYITGFAEFLGNEFKVNKYTLIPRIESEQIIKIALNELTLGNSNVRVIKFCDVGTGSGAIGISFAAELLKRDIKFIGFAVDISKEALDVAQENKKRILGIQDGKDLNTFKLIKSNLLQDLQEDNFDIIFANLPYIPSQRISTLDSSVKDHEPNLALDGGDDGLKLIRQLLIQAPNFLAPKGIVILEVDDTHTDYKEFQNVWIIEAIKDFQGKNRFWKLRLR